MVGWRLTRTTAFEEIRSLFVGLKDKLSNELKRIIVDDCYKVRALHQSVFPGVEVKLDLFHAVQRVSKVIPKGAPNESLEVFNYMDDVLRYATRNNLEVIILGDLNCDCLNTSLQQTTRLQEFLMANELEQLIKDPSRVTRSTTSVIDVLITPTPNLFKASGALSTTFSDHYPTLWNNEMPRGPSNKTSNY